MQMNNLIRVSVGHFLFIYFFCASQIVNELKLCLVMKIGTTTTMFSVDMDNTEIQSTLVISKSKGPSETLRDIRTSTYQICRIKENTNRTTKFHK